MTVVAVDTGNRLIKTAHAEPFSAGLNRHLDVPPIVATDTLFFDCNRPRDGVSLGPIGQKKSRPEYWSGYCRTGRTRYQRELEPDRDGKNPKKSRQNPHPSGIRCHHKLESGR